MKQTLITSEAKQFDYLMLGDEVVVRNFKKILAFFTVHFADHPVGVREVLATPEFSGPKAEEKIEWTTELFESTPVKLSSLKGEEREHYQAILQETLDDVRDMVAVLPEGVSSLLQRAVTYHSDESVFCADDKVVITEWGMFPKGKPEFHTLALEKAKKPRFGPWSNAAAAAPGEPTPPTPEEPEQPADQGYSVGYMPQAAEPEHQEEPPHDEVPPVEEPPVNNADNGQDKGKKKKRWWLWLLLLIPLLLLLLLLRRCGDDQNVLPPVTDDDLEWGNDSLVRIVDNRLILLLTDQKPVQDFVDAFRKKYPDKNKYQLYVPDMDNDLPRVVLGLPKEELESMKQRLPGEFPEYDVMVIDESVFKTGKTFTDPAFGDPQKSWYFKMINVAAAWDYSIGDPDIVVAVIDDGFDVDHPELKGKVVNTYNAVSHRARVYPDPTSGHGTHVAATAVGNAENGEGSSGIAPGCKLMVIKVANEGGIITTSAIVDAVLYAIKNNADVVNMSFGKEFNPVVAMFPPDVQEAFIQTQLKDEEAMWNKIFRMGMTNGKDMAFVMAGGNQDLLIGLDPMQRVEGTIKVSAVQPDTLKADFSNYGDYSILSAPGVKIYNAVSGQKKYDTYDGTSMASPIVAGAFALMKSIYPNLTTAQITALLDHTGIPSPSRVGNIIHFGYALGAYPPPPGGKGGVGNGDDGKGDGKVDDGKGDGGNGDGKVDDGKGDDGKGDGGKGDGKVDDGKGDGGNGDGKGDDGKGDDKKGDNKGDGNGNNNTGNDLNWRDKILPPPAPRPGDPDCPDCTEAQRRYQDLMRRFKDLQRELDDLKRQNPECY